MLIRTNQLIERADARSRQRKIARRMIVQPAILADEGNPRGVAFTAAGRTFTFTEESARELADAIHDALEEST